MARQVYVPASPAQCVTVTTGHYPQATFSGRDATPAPRPGESVTLEPLARQPPSGPPDYLPELAD
jgi:hypothetical protein